MKKVKKVFAVLTALMILSGVMSGINVSAATVAKGDRVWVDVVDDETETIRFKIKQTNDDESYCLEFVSPNNMNKPHSVVDTSANSAEATANGMMRTYGATEELLFMYNGGWVEEDEQNARVVSGFTIGETHDIKIKLDGKYFDGVTNIDVARVYMDDVYCGMFKRKSSNPITAINVYGPGGDISGIETEYISAVGAKKGYMNAKVSRIDYDKKQLTLDFSETPKNADFISNTVLKSTNITNGDTGIPLNLISRDGSRFILGYDGELDNSSECMIIFPDGIESALTEDGTLKPRKMQSNIITFDSTPSVLGTNADNKVSYCDYDDGKATIWVNQPSGIDNSMILINEAEEGEPQNLAHRYYNNGTTWFNGQLFSTDGEITSISMDIKPMKDGLNTTMEFMLPNDKTTPVNIIFGSDGYVLAVYTWAQTNTVSEAYPFDSSALNWLNEAYIGEYKAEQWMNIKLEHNKTKKTMDIFFNGDKKVTLNASSATNLGSIRVRSLGCPYSAGEEIMRFDNIKIEKRVPSVSRVRFTDTDGDSSVLPFGKLNKGLSKVDVEFNETIDANSLSGNVKLMQNGEEIAAKSSFDSTTNTCTLTPNDADSVLSNTNIELVVSGVKNSAGETIEYKTYVRSFDGRIEPFLSVVNSDGEDVTSLTRGESAYVNAGIENYTSADATAQIMIAQYKENRLIGLYLHPVITVQKNSSNGVFYDDPNPLAVSAANGSDNVKVFMLKNLSGGTPWAEVVSLDVK